MPTDPLAPLVAAVFQPAAARPSGRLRPVVVGRPRPLVRLRRRHLVWLTRGCHGPTVWHRPRTPQTLAMPPSAPSPDSADPAAAVVDGVRLAELTESLPVSRGSVFELVKALGIITTKGAGADGRGRVAWVSADDADRLAEAAQRVARGEVRIADLAGGLVSQRTPQTAQTAHAAGSAPSADSADPAPFLARLEAAERAIRSGLGLTTTETAWILGVKPGGSPITRGGIRATRTGWNCWRLESAPSADSAD